MTKRPTPWDDQVDLISSDDSSSSDTDMKTDDGMKTEGGTSSRQRNIESLISRPGDANSFEDITIKRARMYQEYMKLVPIPSVRGSLIPCCNSWMSLAKSIKDLYGQPLHYLTNTLLKQWDQARFKSGEDDQPLDTIIHPLKAELTIWLIEEIHRNTIPYHHLANLWLKDPMHHAFVDSIFPKI